MTDFEETNVVGFTEPFEPWPSPRLSSSDTFADDGSSPVLFAVAMHENGRAVVSVRGEMDIASVPHLERDIRALLALPLDVVVLDLGGVTFMDSSGLSMLNHLRTMADDHVVALFLRDVPDQVVRLLDLTGMTGLFTTE
jgi:anti-anti-sigma factor